MTSLKPFLLRAVAPLLLAAVVAPLSRPQNSRQNSRQNSGQNSAILTGLVTDPAGLLVPNATVVIHPVDNKSGGADQTLSTNRTGRYTFDLPAHSRIALSVTAPGFAPFQSPPIQFLSDEQRTLDVSLNIPAHDEQVDVSDDPSGTDPNRNGNSLTLKGSAIDGLPLDSAQLLQTLQGLSGSDAPDIYVDGFSGGTLPPRDTIREIRINQNPYSAQNDTNPQNGRIEIFTKPGANHLHGDVYSYGNAAGLNTKNPFNADQPSYDSYALYANVNGPLGKHMSLFNNGGFETQNLNALVDAVSLDPFLNHQSVPAPITSFNFSTRFDAAIGKKSTAIARYSINRNDQTNGGVGQLTLASEGFNNKSTNQTLQLSNSQIVSMKIINDTRFQYTRSRVGQIPDFAAPAIIVSGAFNGGGNPGGSYNDNQDRFELQNYVSASAGKHYLNFGGRFRSTRDANDSRANYNGTYTFGSLGLSPACTVLASCSSYQATLQGQAAGLTPAQIRASGGGASQFSITTGNPNVAVTVADGALFFQDDWKARPNLTVSGGLRFETQNAIADHADWAPRFGFALALRKPKDKPAPYTLRGGAGLFYTRFNSGLVLQAARQNGVSQQEFIVNNPDFYPNFTPANLVGATPAQQTVYGISPTLRSPYLISSTVSLERQIKSFGAITLTYLNNRGVHSIVTRNINAPLPGTYDPTLPLSGVRPLGGIGNVYEYDSAGVFRGNRLFTNFYFNFRKRYNLFGYYVLRRDATDANGGGFPSNQYDLRADYGRSTFDSRHQAYFGGNVELPGGFHLSGFSRVQSGLPWNITVGEDLNGDSIFNDRPAYATDLSRPSVVHTALGNFDTRPLPGQPIIPINMGHGPGLFFVNLQLRKSISFGPEVKRPGGAPAPKLAPGEKPHIDRKYTLQFGFEAENLFNQVNLAPPIGTLSSPLFGRSISLSTNGGAANSANRIINLETFFHF